MTEPGEKTMAFEEDWKRWQSARWRDISAPHGIAALAATVWLTPAMQHVDGVAGLWRADGDTITANGLTGVGYTHPDGTPVADRVTLGADDTLHAGDTLLRVFVREGTPALRHIDPHTERRTTLRSIEAYRPDPAWMVEARYTSRDEPLEVEQFDGHRTLQSDVGTLEFTLGGQARRFTARRASDALAVVFADATNGGDRYRFRFLRLPLATETGATTIDFNRAFLPPCAFSDHYVCPLPSPENRLDIAVTVGERLPVYDGERR